MPMFLSMPMPVPLPTIPFLPLPCLCPMPMPIHTKVKAKQKAEDHLAQQRMRFEEKDRQKELRAVEHQEAKRRGQERMLAKSQAKQEHRDGVREQFQVMEEAKRRQLERRDFENEQRLLGYQLMKYGEQCAQQEQVALRERKLKKALDDVRRRQEDEREAIAAHIQSKDNRLNRMMSHRKLQQQVNLESERLREQHRQAHRDRYHNRQAFYKLATIHHMQMKLSKPSVKKVKQEVAAAIQQHSGRLSVENLAKFQSADVYYNRQQKAMCYACYNNLPVPQLPPPAHLRGAEQPSEPTE